MLEGLLVLIIPVLVFIKSCVSEEQGHGQPSTVRTRLLQGNTHLQPSRPPPGGGCVYTDYIPLPPPGPPGKIVELPDGRKRVVDAQLMARLYAGMPEAFPACIAFGFVDSWERERPDVVEVGMQSVGNSCCFLHPA